MIEHMISYQLYCDGVVVDEFGNGQKVHKLVTDSNDACKKLKIVEHPLELYNLPNGLVKNKNETGLNKYVHRLDTILGGKISPDPLNEDETEFNPSQIEEKYNINFELWERRAISGNKDTFDFVKIYAGRSFEKTLKFHFVVELGILLYIVDEDLYFKTLFKCPNSSFRCYFKTAKKTDFDRHVKICEDPKIKRQHPHAKQLEYGRNFHPINELRREELLTEEPVLTDHIFYDIESMVRTKDRQVKNTTILGEHQLLSIGRVRNWEILIKYIEIILTIKYFLKDKLQWTFRFKIFINFKFSFF